MRILIPGPDAAERTDVHDAARAGLLHKKRALLAAEKRGFQIYIMDEVPVGFSELQRIAAAESSVRVLVVKTQEEWEIARETRRVLGQGAAR